jgi:hypothetical protein
MEAKAVNHGIRTGTSLQETPGARLKSAPVRDLIFAPKSS